MELNPTKIWFLIFCLLPVRKMTVYGIIGHYKTAPSGGYDKRLEAKKNFPAQHSQSAEDVSLTSSSSLKGLENLFINRAKRSLPVHSKNERPSATRERGGKAGEMEGLNDRYKQLQIRWKRQRQQRLLNVLHNYQLQQQQQHQQQQRYQRHEKDLQEIYSRNRYDPTSPPIEPKYRYNSQQSRDQTGSTSRKQRNKKRLMKSKVSNGIKLHQKNTHTRNIGKKVAQPNTEAEIEEEEEKTTKQTLDVRWELIERRRKARSRTQSKQSKASKPTLLPKSKIHEKRLNNTRNDHEMNIQKSPLHSVTTNPDIGKTGVNFIRRDPEEKSFEVSRAPGEISEDNNKFLGEHEGEKMRLRYLQRNPKAPEVLMVTEMTTMFPFISTTQALEFLTRYDSKPTPKRWPIKLVKPSQDMPKISISSQSEAQATLTTNEIEEYKNSKPRISAERKTYDPYLDVSVLQKRNEDVMDKTRPIFGIAVQESPDEKMSQKYEFLEGSGSHSVEESSDDTSLERTHQVVKESKKEKPSSIEMSKQKIQGTVKLKRKTSRSRDRRINSKETFLERKEKRRRRRLRQRMLKKYERLRKRTQRRKQRESKRVQEQEDKKPADGLQPKFEKQHKNIANGVINKRKQSLYNKSTMAPITMETDRPGQVSPQNRVAFRNPQTSYEIRATSLNISDTDKSINTSTPTTPEPNTDPTLKTMNYEQEYISPENQGKYVTEQISPYDNTSVITNINDVLNNKSSYRTRFINDSNNEGFVPYEKENYSSHANLTGNDVNDRNSSKIPGFQTSAEGTNNDNNATNDDNNTTNNDNNATNDNNNTSDDNNTTNDGGEIQDGGELFKTEPTSTGSTAIPSEINEFTSTEINADLSGSRFISSTERTPTVKGTSISGDVVTSKSSTLQSSHDELSYSEEIDQSSSVTSDDIIFGEGDTKTIRGHSIKYHPLKGKLFPSGKIEGAAVTPPSFIEQSTSTRSQKSSPLKNIGRRIMTTEKPSLPNGQSSAAKRWRNYLKSKRRKGKRKRKKYIDEEEKFASIDVGDLFRNRDKKDEANGGERKQNVEQEANEKEEKYSTTSEETPFITYKTAYDFLSNQKGGRGQVVNEKQRESREFNRHMSEGMCEIFNKHYVPTRIGGKCE